MPETSIIIRTFNEEKHIGNLLRAIKEQDYKDCEIILVDSGSTDRTLEIAKDSVDKIIQIENRDFTFGYSLNMGCRKGRGKYLVFISAHTLPVDNYWLSNLLEAFKDKKVAVVYGRQISTKDAKFSEKRDFKRIFGRTSLKSSTFSFYANNANAAVRKELWQQRPFDEYLFGLEDAEWTKYIVGKGFWASYEPKAAVYHIHQEKWPQVFNRYRREAIAAARIGMNSPPQAKPSYFWLASNLFQDFLCSFPNISPARLEEITRFRYLQWKGTRQGWYYDRNINFNQEKYALAYPASNTAVVIQAKHRAGIEQISLPEMNPGDVLIRVSYVGICRTDLEVYDGSLGYYKNGLAHYPIVPGHEFSGTIVRIGANAKCQEQLKVGEAVVGECILSRGTSSQRREVGVINHNGAYGQFIVIPGEYIHKIPENLDLKTACLTEPLAVVLRGLKRISYRLKAKDSIAVIGAGPIGNLCAQVLINLGYRVFVFDKNKARLGFLKDRAEKTFKTLTSLKDFNAIIEATGSSRVLEKVVRTSRSDATILLLGFPYGDIRYNFEDLVGQEKAIIGSVGGGEDEFEEALELLPKLETFQFTQAVLPLEEFKKAWELQRSLKYLKVILKASDET